MSKERFDMLCRISRQVGESRDCVVKAVALLTHTSYQDVNRIMLTNRWREPRRGANFQLYKGIFPYLGFELIQWQDYLWQGYGKTVRTFGRNFRANKNLLIRTNSHALAVIGGEVCDWTDGRCHRIKAVYEVKPIK